MSKSSLPASSKSIQGLFSGISATSHRPVIRVSSRATLTSPAQTIISIRHLIILKSSIQNGELPRFHLRNRTRQGMSTDSLGVKHMEANISPRSTVHFITKSAHAVMATAAPANMSSHPTPKRSSCRTCTRIQPMRPTTK